MKTFQKFLGLSLLPLMAACAAPAPTNSSGFIEELPEELLAIVAPNQDLAAVRVLPDDGCYWYQWVGPVETTFLPLLTLDGRMICTRS